MKRNWIIAGVTLFVIVVAEAIYREPLYQKSLPIIVRLQTERMDEARAEKWLVYSDWAERAANLYPMIVFFLIYP